MLKVSSNSNITIKLQIDGRINLYCYCVDCGSKKVKTIDKEELRDLLKTIY